MRLREAEAFPHLRHSPEQPTVLNSTISGNMATAMAAAFSTRDLRALRSVTVDQQHHLRQLGRAGGGLFPVCKLQQPHQRHHLRQLRQCRAAVSFRPARSTPGTRSLPRTMFSAAAPRTFFGTLSSQGYNLIGNTSGTTITGTTTGNQLNVNPLLGSLLDNGGPTKTHALGSGSTAIEGGHSSGADTDQRGLARPVVIPSSCPSGRRQRHRRLRSASRPIARLQQSSIGSSTIIMMPARAHCAS